MTVYKITNLINSKIYIGITTTTLARRISSYKSSTKRQIPDRHRIVMAMKKHGFENFIFDVIFEATDKDQLKLKEIEFISQYDSCNPLIGYNVSRGGYLHSDDTLKKLSNASKGRKLSKEHKAKIATSLMGHKVSQKVRNNAKESVKKFAGWNKGTKGVMKPNSGSFQKKV